MRALKVKIRGLKKSQFKRFKELTHHAKNLYNQSLYILREAFEATGKYFSYPQMDKAMKQVKNLEGETNYRLLKAKVAQQTNGAIKTLSRFSMPIRIGKRISRNIRANQNHLILNEECMII